nr:ABC transporter ATP-binding protein/permease [Cellvibrionaceae bacterium]
GESGSGKSTLLQLLAGFYMPQVGRVKYGGRALFDCRRQQVYQHIAYAMQDNTIFHDSIKNNITMGDKGISDEQVWQVLSLVKADTFVAQKPGQLAFVFEGQHSRLSGGEQQRLGIARVLIKPAQCYFFDEATRFFDPKMEGEVIDNIMHGLSEKTVIFVTHRIENIHFADRVIVLSKGCVVGFDNHENLLKNCEVYQALQNQHLNNSLRKATNHHKGNWRYA